MQNGNAQNVTEPDFRKKIFNAGNMPENQFFGISSRFSLFFSDFLLKECVLAMLKTWPSSIFEKNVFLAKNTGNMLEIAVFADFHWSFSLYFVV